MVVKVVCAELYNADTSAHAEAMGDRNDEKQCSKLCQSQ